MCVCVLSSGLPARLFSVGRVLHRRYAGPLSGAFVESVPSRVVEILCGWPLGSS